MVKAVPFLLIAFTGCSDGNGGGGPDLAAPACAMPGGPHQARWVVDRLLLPLQSSDYAIDLNGNGVPDNQFGNIVAALTLQGTDVMKQVNDNIAAGEDVRLVEIESSDPALTTDLCAVASALTGLAMPAGDGGVMGPFAIDTTVPPGRFVGGLMGGVFDSPSPVTTTAPVTAGVRLPITGAAPIAVPLIGAHLGFTIAGGAIMTGQLHGAIRKEVVQGTIIPAIVMGLNAKIAKDPTNASNQSLLTMFDVGGCTNPDGSQAKTDGKVDICEFASNLTIKNVLAPDVQMFDAAGHYAPNPANTTKDSLSFGVAFTAVPASF
jgi:hypothetical protein